MRRLPRIFVFLSVFVTIAAYGAWAVAQTTDDPGDSKTTTQTTQEVQTTLPTAPINGDKPATVPSTTTSGKTNKEAEKLSEMMRELGYCVENKDRILRLRCFDDYTTKLGLMDEDFKLKEREKLGAYGFWNVVSEKDTLGIETLYLSLVPYNKLGAVTLSAKTPTFNIRCRQGNTDAYVDWKSQLNGGRVLMKDIYVYVKVDSEPEYRYVWSLSLDAFAAFSPHPIEFIKKLRGKRKMLIRITPAGGTMETLSFEIGYLEKALDIMVKRCYAQGAGQDDPTKVRTP
jgi:hypothetical protein